LLALVDLEKHGNLTQLLLCGELKPGLTEREELDGHLRNFLCIVLLRTDTGSIGVEPGCPFQLGP